MSLRGVYLFSDWSIDNSHLLLCTQYEYLCVFFIVDTISAAGLRNVNLFYDWSKDIFMVYTVRAVHLRGVYLFLYWSIDKTVNAVGQTQIL